MGFGLCWPSPLGIGKTGSCGGYDGYLVIWFAPIMAPLILESHQGTQFLFPSDTRTTPWDR